MKRSITKRELNQQTARVLARVKAGKPVLVTERGVARWRIEAVEADADPVARMRTEGLITPASRAPAPWPDEPADPRYTARRIATLLDEIRGDR